MIDAVAKGDEVVTAGGVLGKISKVGESFLGLEVANGVEIQIQRSAVVQVLPKRHGQVIICNLFSRLTCDHEPLPGVEIRDHLDRTGGGGCCTRYPMCLANPRRSRSRPPSPPCWMLRRLGVEEALKTAGIAPEQVAP